MSALVSYSESESFRSLWLVTFVALAVAGGLMVLAQESEAQATQLKFLPAPATAASGEAFAPTVRVGVYNAGNTLVTSPAVTVTLTLTSQQCPNPVLPAPRPCGRLLEGAADGQQGTIQATTVSGFASFPTLRVDTVGIGYRITASTPGLTSAVSPLFDVTPGQAWPEFHKNSGRAAAQSFGASMATPSVLANLVATAGRPITASPLILDLDRDGLLDVVVAQDFANVPSGTPIIQAFRQSPPGSFASMWTYSGFPAFTNVKDGKAVLAGGDLNADAYPEVLVYWAGFTDAGAQAFISGHDLRALNGMTGVALATWTPPGTLVDPIVPAIGDVNGNGVTDVILLYHGVAGTFSRAANSMAILNLNAGFFSTVANGALPGIPFSCAPALTCTYPNSYFAAPPVVGEMRAAHAGLEVVIGSTSATTPPAFIGTKPPGVLFLCQPTTVIACSETLGMTNVPNEQTSGTAPQVYGMATADLNGDGNLEVVVNSRYLDGVAPASMTRTLSVVRTSPSLAMYGQQADGFLWNSPALADLDGDGKSDIANVKFSTDAGDNPKQGDVEMRALPVSTIANLGILPRPVPAGQSSTESQGGGALVNLNYATGVPPRYEHVFGSADNTLVATTLGIGPMPALYWGTAPTTAATPISPPAVADLSGDCRPELLFGLANGNIARLGGVAASAPSVVPDLNGVITGPPWTSPGQGVQAKLYWNLPASDGGLPILDYRVYRSTTPTGTYTEVGVWRGLTVPTQLNPFTDTTIPTPGDYYYKVRAVNCVGEGPVQATPFWSEVKLPFPPGSASAYQWGQPVYVATPSPQVSLSWTAAPPNSARPNGCAAIDGYNIYRSTISPVALTPANRLNGALLSTSTFAYLDTTPANLLYYYVVAASNCVGDYGNEMLLDLRVPAAPASLVGTDVGGVNLAWTVPSAANGCGWIEGYRIERSDNGGPFVFLAEIRPAGVSWTRALPPAAPVGSIPLSYFDATAIGGTFTFRVSAVNCVGVGPFAEVTVVSNTIPPPSPTCAPLSQFALVGEIVTLSATGGSGTFDWSGGGTPPTASGPTFDTAFGATGTYPVQVASGPATDLCDVVVVDPVTCSPDVGTVQYDTPSNFVAGGGDGNYAWTATGALPASGSGNPFVTSFPLGGTYGVSVTSAGLTASCAVTVIQPCGPFDAEFVVSTTNPSVGQSVTFQDTSTGDIVDRMWDFGDGATGLTSSALHAYEAAGTYHIRLSVTENGSNCIRSHDIDLQVGPLTSVAEDFSAGTGSGGVGAPMVDAGPDLSVLEGDRVQLHGAANGEDGDGLAFMWTLVQGPSGIPTSGSGQDLAFTAPMLTDPDQPMTLIYELRASRGGAVSPSDIVEVLVGPSNLRPTAEGGEDVEVARGASRTLDGSLSSDPDGDTLTYDWQVMDGAAIELTGATTEQPTVTVPDDAAAVFADLQLTVSDGRWTSMDTIRVWILPAPPVPSGFLVREQAAGTFQFVPDVQEGDFLWSFGDEKTSTEVAPVHSYEEDGTYTVRLTVTDAAGSDRVYTEAVTVSRPDADVAGEATSSASALPWVFAGMGLLAAAAGAGVFLFMRRRR